MIRHRLTSIRKRTDQNDLVHAQLSSCCLSQGPNSTKQQEEVPRLGLSKTRFQLHIT